MTSTTIKPDSRRTDLPVGQSDEWIHAAYYAPDFVGRVNRELDRLASLPPNWDAQGAVSIDPAVIQAVRTFVDKLPDSLIRVPAVVPMAKGNLQFEWHSGPRSLELEFDDPHTVHYLKWHPEEGVEEEGLSPIADVDRAVAQIRWFVRGVRHV